MGGVGVVCNFLVDAFLSCRVWVVGPRYHKTLACLTWFDSVVGLTWS